jgi:diguanylate cyclase (GGDEF)-like protein/PAS domain S-box-containing protein
LGGILFDLKDEAAMTQPTTTLEAKPINFQSLFEESPDALFLVNSSWTVLLANQAAQQLVSMPSEELRGRRLIELVEDSDKESFLTAVARSLRGDQDASATSVRFVRTSGELRTVELHLRELSANQNGANLLLACRDISELGLQLKHAAELAYADSLTGLGNQRKFEDAARHEIAMSERHGRPFSILLLDLDRLKEINDTHGHLAGNRAICRLASVLEHQCRATDTAGRFGGDEFYLIMPEANATDALFCAERIRKMLGEDSETPGVSASIGIATYPEDGLMLDALTATADAELYRVKRARSKEEKVAPRKVSRLYSLPLTGEPLAMAG